MKDSENFREGFHVSINEKIFIIEDCMDLEAGTLNLAAKLANLEEWDSLVVLAVVAAVEEKTGNVLTYKDLKGAVTVKDIVDLIR